MIISAQIIRGYYIITFDKKPSIFKDSYLRKRGYKYLSADVDTGYTVVDMRLVGLWNQNQSRKFAAYYKRRNLTC